MEDKDLLKLTSQNQKVSLVPPKNGSTIMIQYVWWYSTNGCFYFAV